MASWMHLPVGPMFQDFLGVTEAVAGVGRDLPRASLPFLGFRTSGSHRVHLAIGVSGLALGALGEHQAGVRDVEAEQGPPGLLSGLAALGLGGLGSCSLCAGWL